MTAVRDLLYGCLLVVCLGLLAIQCYDLVALYNSEPTTVNKRMEPAGSMSMPGLTICSNTGLRADVLADWGMLRDNIFDREIDWYGLPDNATMDQLWMAAAVDLNRLVTCRYGACDSSGARGGPGSSLGHWTPLLHRLGVCYTLRLNRPMDPTDIMNDLFFDFNVLHGVHSKNPKVYVYFHGEKAPVIKLDKQEESDVIIPHPYVTVGPEEKITVRVSAELEMLTSLRRRPCNSERRHSLDFCRQQCLWRMQATRCRPPWIPGPAEQSCRTTYEMMSTVSPLTIHDHQVLERCDCNIGCTSEQWTIKERERSITRNIVMPNVSRLQIRWAEQVSITTEQLTYGVSSLLSDIGGIIGILFGASIVGLVQMSEGWLKAALAGRRWCRRRRQTAVQAEEGEGKREIKKPLDAWNGPDAKNQGDGAGELATEDGLWNTGAKQGPELGGMHQELMDIEQMQVV